jgi:uncharacterized protein
MGWAEPFAKPTHRDRPRHDGYRVGRGAPFYAGASEPAPIRPRILGRIAPPLLSLRVSGTILHVKYEWDDGNAAVNLRKHGVDFADAIAALEDENRLEEIDSRFVYDDERIRVIGMAHDKVLFVIVVLPGEDTCRIISARKATRHEQDRYYAGDLETR